MRRALEADEPRTVTRPGAQEDRSRAPRPAAEVRFPPDSLLRDPQQAQRLLHRFSTLTSDFVYSVEIAPDGSFHNHWLSEAFERVFGYSYDELRSLGWRSLVIPEDLPEAQLRLERLLAGDSYEGELRTRARDGSLRWIHDRARAVTGADGRVVEIYGAASDVTARRQTEERRRLDRRAERLESLGALAAGIAHDFNNILVSVLGHADLALDMLPRESAVRESVEELGRGAQHAADLAQQLLDFAGEARGRAERLDLSRAVGEMEKLLRVSVQRRAAVHCELAEALPPILGDRGQIRQVTMNLILNAADAVAAGAGAADAEAARGGGGYGTIRVRTAAALPSGSSIAEALGSHLFDQDFRDDPNAPAVLLEVVDDGCGMDEETRRRLFDPFFTTKPSGRGLGMATVLGVVRSHRGAIRVVSRPGDGTTVRIALPVAAHAEPAVSADAGAWPAGA